MSTTDPTAPVPSVDPGATEDHCLVHHFIRAHGRRPTATELEDLRAHATVVRPERPRHAAASPGLALTLRREVARLVNRL